MLSKNNPKFLFFLAILTGATTICAVPGFVKISLPDPSLFKSVGLSAYLLLVSLLFYFCALKRHWWGWGGLILSLIGAFGLFRALFPNSQSLSQWLSRFLQAIELELQNLSRFNFSVVPQELATLIAVSFITVVLWVSIYFQFWYLPFPIILIYLLFISVFDGQDHLGAAILALALFGLEVFGVTNQDTLFAKSQKSFKLWLLGGIILFLSLGIGLIFRHNFVQLARVVDSPGIKVRNRLNTLGFYQTLNNQKSTSNTQHQKAGFSQNPRELGGPVFDNPQLVYRVWQQQPHYLRLDVKHQYNGRGFSDPISVGSAPKTNSLVFNAIQLPQRRPTTTLKIIFAKNQRNLAKQLIPQIYGKTDFKFKDQKINTLTQNSANEFFQYDNSLDQVNQLVFQVNDYDFNSPKLRTAKLPAIPSAIKKIDTKLPQRLPQRVIKLARRLTASQPSQWEKVKTVENYLKTNRKFTYTRLDVPQKIPRGQDFVDYFLFDSQTGYCDHFAAAMLVLLRAVNIPTRYAEGYAPGSYRQQIGELSEYEIRSHHAHSWPEVYFAGIGWIPFEPTPGFKQQAGALNAPAKVMGPPPQASTSSTSSTGSPRSFANSGRMPSKDQHSSKQTPKKKQQRRRTAPNQSRKSKIHLIILVILGCSAGLGFIWGVWHRQALRWGFYRLLLNWGLDPKRVYWLILRKFERILPRAKSQSLQNYASLISQFYPQIGKLFLGVTADYESQIYGQVALSSKFKSHLKQLLQLLFKNPQIKKAV